MSRSTVTMRVHRAVVRDVERLTPGMVRVTFAGPGLAGFETTGVGDEYLRVMFPRDGEPDPVLPVATESWFEYADGVEPLPLRTYTVRDVPEPGVVVVDFVVHDGGVAAAWALRARPGDVVGLNSPTGLYDPPAGLAWQLLLADATGLPAAARLLEQAPAGVRTRAVLEVTGPDDEQPLAVGPHVEVAWLHGGNGHGPSRLEEVLRGVTLPDGVGYVWFAGETRVLRAVRKYLRHELGLPATAYKTVGYWTDAAESADARWEALAPAVKARIEALWDQEGKDEEEIVDEYHEVLESVGL